MAATAAVTTISSWPQVTTDPSARIAANACLSCLKLLDALQLILDFRAVTTISLWPPSHDWPMSQYCSKCALSCLNRPAPFSRYWTSELSPPKYSWPHVTTRSPPQQNKAKVVAVATNFASVTAAVRRSPSSSPAACRDSVGSITLWSAATSPKKPRWQDFCANALKSPYFGGLRNRKLLTATAWQSYTWSISQETPTQRTNQFLQLSQAAPVLSIGTNFQDQLGIQNPLLEWSLNDAKQSPVIPVLTILNVVRPSLAWMCRESYFGNNNP